MRTAVVTVVHGRSGHLRNQLRGLQRSDRQPDLHVVVAIDDPTVALAIAEERTPATVVACPRVGARLPIGHARNVGADAALAAGAQLLVFLDVDCVPAAALVGRYQQVADDHAHRHALLCGAVTYLPPSGPNGYDLARLEPLRRPHPARPDPPDGTVVIADSHELFWSLSFAVTEQTWVRIGGFWVGYTGYGGEDTDFGQSAAAAGVPLHWVGGADAFHQHHPVSDPPVEHVADIVRNAALFHQRWGWWPMTGWLEQFERLALITRDHDGRPRLNARLARGTGVDESAWNIGGD